MLLPSACRQETILVAPPADTTGSGGGGGGGGSGGTVRRAPLTVHVVVPAADSSVALALGWSGGLIPGAVVTARHVGFSDTTTGITDSRGTVTLDHLLAGTYVVSTLRVITRLERPRLDSADQDVDALAGIAASVSVDTPGVVQTILTAAGRRGTLLVSEYWFPASLSATDFYPYGGFLEIYNNSDTTIYLDGKIFADGELTNPSVSTSSNSCTNYSTYMNDPDGVWAWRIFRFPGSGFEHPIQPGQAMVLATDALDHRVVNPDAEDLSHADFEFTGGSDPDNPAVPNMINLSQWSDPFGHGWFASSTHSGPLLANSVSLDTLPSAVLYTTQLKYYRIPRAAVLGMISSLWTGGQYATCSPLVNAAFDQQPFSLPSSDFYAPSFQRRVSRVLPDGRKILQNTRNSALDFAYQLPRTPGYIP